MTAALDIAIFAPGPSPSAGSRKRSSRVACSGPISPKRIMLSSKASIPSRASLISSGSSSR